MKPRIRTSATPAGGAVLLTGATGFLGTELLARYLEQDTGDVIALVRASDDRAAQRRLDATLAGALGEAAAGLRPRVRAVAADVGRPGLGLSPRKRNDLAERTELVVHCAAAVSFDQPIGCAREVNVGGTSEMLAFAQTAMDRGGLARYVHISTAFVGGTHPGVFSERDLYLGQGFRNTYEQSKCEAELLVRAARHLPTTVLRPSIVVGDRHSGWTSAFNVIYWPLRAFAKGLLRSVPAVPSSPVDVVSVDYVAEAVRALAAHPAAAGRTYNLTAGSAISTLGEIASLASSYFRQPAPRLIPPAQFDFAGVDPMRQRVFAEAGVYFPYFTTETVFDSSESQAVLGPLGVRPSPLPDYLHRLLDFATRSRWGKRQIPRHEGRRQAGPGAASSLSGHRPPAPVRLSNGTGARLARSLA